MVPDVGSATKRSARRARLKRCFAKTLAFLCYAVSALWAKSKWTSSLLSQGELLVVVGLTNALRCHTTNFQATNDAVKPALLVLDPQWEYAAPVPVPE